MESDGEWLQLAEKNKLTNKHIMWLQHWACSHSCFQNSQGLTRGRGVVGGNHPSEKGKPTNKSVQSPFHMFSIEIWWIFCHRAFEVIAERAVQRNAHLGHCLPSLCCRLHCALLTLCFSKEQHPTPPINASLGLILAVSRGGELVSRLFRQNSHTQTFTTEEKLLRAKPGYCLTPLFSHPPPCGRARVHHQVFLFVNLFTWSSNNSKLLSVTSSFIKAKADSYVAS